MNLPEGVLYRANQKVLCGRKDNCLIRLPDGYEDGVVDVRAGLIPFLSGDWAEWAARYSSILDPSYRPETSGEAGSQPLPAYAFAYNSEFRIEIIPEIYESDEYGERRHPVLLATRVALSPSKTPISPVGRIYEFQTFGMAVIDSGVGFLDVWLAKPGDKLLAPARSACSLYGLGETLITLELGRGGSESEEDHVWRSRLVQSGPPILGYYSRKEVVFALNRLHVNSAIHQFGVRLPAKPAPEDRSIRILRITRSALAPYLHHQLTTNPDLIARFYSLGMRIGQARPEVILPEDPLRRRQFPMPIHFSGSLNCERRTSSLVRTYLFDEPVQDPVDQKPMSAAWQESFKSKLTERVDALTRLVDLQPETTQSFSIVIEGTGEWTARCYRPAILAIKKKAQRPINVFYANDETWKPAPSWLGELCVRGQNEEEWLTEMYWNKADPGQRKQYDKLNDVAAVFVVTPDVTHAETAEFWLGKTPVVFVEKPFDTDAERFRGLLYAMALSEVDGAYKTAVVGIDHYLMRLNKIFKYLDPILSKLEGFAEVSFTMTERNPIEKGRERTLSLGLGMDLLPHFVALMVLLGPLESVDLVRILRAIQYDSLDLLKFDNETGLTGRCRMNDYTEARIEARFCAGKGVEPAAKRLQLRGKSGHDVLIDFGLNTVDCGGVPLANSIMNTEQCYVTLMEDLFYGRSRILSSCLNVYDGERVVRFLDAMWRATQWIKQSRGLESVKAGTGICEV